MRDWCTSEPSARDADPRSLAHVSSSCGHEGAAVVVPWLRPGGRPVGAISSANVGSALRPENRRSNGTTTVSEKKRDRGRGLLRRRLGWALSCRSPPREFARRSTSASPVGRELRRVTAGRATREMALRRYAGILGASRVALPLAAPRAAAGPQGPSPPAGERPARNEPRRLRAVVVRPLPPHRPSRLRTLSWRSQASRAARGGRRRHGQRTTRYVPASSRTTPATRVALRASLRAPGPPAAGR